EFAMCPLCAGQYADPGDRRFHAQPIACPACGPSVRLLDTEGADVGGGDPVAAAAALLREGRIVAVKGLGGFHLACRADRQDVVERLRQRKRRDDKPFAVMVADLTAAREIAELTPESEELLAGAIRPIVLVPAKPQAALAPGVSRGLATVGVMLPYTPLHHLLCAEGLGPLVMTSGNVSDEPIVADNDEAMTQLTTIADAVLLHNRPIRHAIDDSVVQLHRDGRLCVLRRARGYAPVPVRLDVLEEAFGPDSPTVLAVGAELKNAVALLAHGRVVLGEHVGDLKDARVYRHFMEAIASLEALFEVAPALIAADLHPQYLSTEYALRRHRGLLPGRPACPIVRVQHHHAHIAACLAENGRLGPAIGLACDGVGYGDDGAVWGGEVLLADLADHRRLGHLRYTPLP
ncbi:MAG: Sua5/YciO/YrdC/YwlC family protein, partial [Planctomycetota bacterium]|nr:Sua5/YciO/YrdC/YwlC family protein [Planctomycetota bacterium]